MPRIRKSQLLSRPGCQGECSNRLPNIVTRQSGGSESARFQSLDATDCFQIKSSCNWLPLTTSGTDCWPHLASSLLLIIESLPACISCRLLLQQVYGKKTFHHTSVLSRLWRTERVSLSHQSLSTLCDASKQKSRCASLNFSQASDRASFLRTANNSQSSNSTGTRSFWPPTRK